MNRLVVGLLLILILGMLPGIASAGTLCVQLDDNGDVLVMRGIGKGSKAVSGYLAEYKGGGFYLPKPVSGSSLQDKGDLAVGLTEFEVGIGTFTENIVFHRLRCTAGSDGKLAPVDSCIDIVKNTAAPRRRRFGLDTSFRAFPKSSSPDRLTSRIRARRLAGARRRAI